MNDEVKAAWKEIYAPKVIAIFWIRHESFAKSNISKQFVSLLGATLHNPAAEKCYYEVMDQYKEKNS